MKRCILSVLLIFLLNDITAQEYKIITTIESVVPGGLGRSRMIKTDDQGKSEEIKMKNFFSMTGINFGNIVENDQMIAKMLNDLGEKGWELVSITPGVYAADKSTGIFISRYLFKRDEEED